MFKRLTLAVVISATMLVITNCGAETPKTDAASMAINFGPIKVGSITLDNFEKLRTEIHTATQHLEQFEEKRVRAQQIDWGKIIKIVLQLIDAYEEFEMAVKAPLPPIKPVTQWEYVQNLSTKYQQWYWHTPQGTYFMPYAWFLALETPKPWKKIDRKAINKNITVIVEQFLADKQDGKFIHDVSETSQWFASPDYLARFGMLTTPKSPYNPDGLPAGLTKQDDFVDPKVINGEKQTVLGMSCALCHTGKVQYKGQFLYVDGAPAQINLDLFGAKLVVSLIQTLLPDSFLPPWKFSRFDRFATKVYGDTPSTLEWFTLYIKLADYLIANAQEINTDLPTTPAGFFRLDALDQIGNQVFGVEMDSKINMAPTTAPVSYPMIWTVPWLAWAEYPGVVRNPMIRNVGEALGVKAPVNLTTADLSLLYKSTVLVDNLYRFETLLMENKIPVNIEDSPTEDPWEYVKHHKALPGLQPPSWKAAAAKNLLPPIDETKIAAGKRLYEELCQICHLPPLNDPAIGMTDAEGNLNPAYWEPKSADVGVAPQYQRQFLKVNKFNIQEIGTDPQTVLNFAQRFPDFANMTWGPESGIKRNINTTNADGTQKVGQTITMADGLKYTTQATANRWYRDKGITDEATIIRLNGYRPNVVLLEPTYRARPLDGIWATGPFLHNGSVANLYELLLPTDQRAKEFIVGETEFDPVKVGFISYEQDSDADKRAEKQMEGYTLFTVNDSKGNPILGNSNAGHEFKGDGTELGEGIVGRELSEDERYALIEYLKTL